jgi:uncharacterized membrane protein YeaQ/YmgE (transglycosylase-associated protein family)
MDLMLSILGWIVVGLVAGAVARLLIPGRQPIGIAMTIGLGIIGSLVGGFIGWAIMGADEPFAPAGWIMSIVGATIVLGLFVMVGGRRSRI